MIIKLLGILDIIAALVFWIFGMFGLLPQTLVLVVALYLLIKGILFLISADIASILDVICSIIIFISLSYPMPKIIVILVALFLLQKGIISLIA